MKKISIFLIINFIIINLVQAEIYKFFEFAPNLGKKFEITPGNIFIQKFIPFNDFLSLIRIWIENVGLPTRFNFQLFDSNGINLINKEINVPSTNFSWSGITFDIPLGRNIAINSGQEYKIKIFTQEQNNLKIFAFSLLELVQNIETLLNLPETIKPLLINNEEQDYSFKIALYEGLERTPPIISNLSTKLIDSYSTELSFNANEPIRYDIFIFDQLINITSTHQVNYFETCPNNFRKCLFLINTQPERNYYLKLIAYDYWENSSTADLNFNTFVENNITSNNFSNNFNNSTSTVNNSPQSLNVNIISSSDNNKKSTNNKFFNTDINKDIHKKTTSSNSHKNLSSKNHQLSENKQLSKKLTKKESEILQNVEQKKIFTEEKNLTESYSLSSSKIKNQNNLTEKKKESYFEILIFIFSALVFIFVIVGLIIIKKRK